MVLRRTFLGLSVVMLAAMPLTPAAAAGNVAVDLALVLAVDASLSVDPKRSHDPAGGLHLCAARQARP